jgi:hypothetical protein
MSDHFELRRTGNLSVVATFDELHGESGNRRWARMSQDGQRVVIGHVPSGSVQVYDAKGGLRLSRVVPELVESWGRSVLHLGQELFLVASSGEVLQVIELHSASVRLRRPGATYGVLSADARWLATLPRLCERSEAAIEHGHHEHVERGRAEQAAQDDDGHRRLNLAARLA